MRIRIKRPWLSVSMEEYRPVLEENGFELTKAKNEKYYVEVPDIETLFNLSDVLGWSLVIDTPDKFNDFEPQITIYDDYLE